MKKRKKYGYILKKDIWGREYWEKEPKKEEPKKEVNYSFGH